MGRGRAKAKQQKVARGLKYSTQHTDFDALQRELGGSADPDAPYTDELEAADDDRAERDEYDQDDWAQASR